MHSVLRLDNFQGRRRSVLRIWSSSRRLASHHREFGAGTDEGSLMVGRTGTRIEIVLLSRRAVLGLPGRGRVRVGRSVVTAAAAGEMRFSVALNARARRALRARKTLRVLVRVKASAPTTASVERLRAVRLTRAPGRSQNPR